MIGEYYGKRNFKRYCYRYRWKFFLECNNARSGAGLSSIGYKALEVNIGNRSSLSITMEEDTEVLDEVVVVGYGTMRKSNLSEHPYQ